MKLPVVRYSPDGAVFETFIGSEATVTHTNTQSINKQLQYILSNMWYLAGLVSMIMNSLRLIRGSYFDITCIIFSRKKFNFKGHVYLITLFIFLCMGWIVCDVKQSVIERAKCVYRWQRGHVPGGCGPTRRRWQSGPPRQSCSRLPYPQPLWGSAEAPVLLYIHHRQKS